jgi:uncharacterized protein YndB with AHSA1/START domain
MSQPFLYSVEREYPVSIAKLWHAWVDAAALEEWYHPTDLSSVKGATLSDLTVGGLWSCGVDVPAHNFAAYFFGKYTTIVENELLVHTMHYTESKEAFAATDFSTPSHEVIINFESRGDSSWVKFSQYGELPEGQAERAQAGMESYFDSLGKFLSK